MHDISRLIYRSIIGRLSERERQILDKWIEESQENKKFVEDLVDMSALDKGWRITNRVNVRRPAADMQRQIDHIKRREIMRVASITAAACALIGIGVWVASHVFLTNTAAEVRQEMAMAKAAPLTIDDIKPGTSKARLISASGETLELDAKGSGKKSYMFTAASNTPESEPEDLCLVVPRGGEFRLILEDSTIVWLNSQSTLRYPEVFTGAERRVEITGEAYFEVRKDENRPFYVESNGQEIRVYGTSFNVKAYDDEPVTYTTLESGVISLRQADGKSGEIMLSPGHQARYSREEQNIDMRVVNTETVTQWRHGRFVFEDQTLEEIMRDLSRWYDFEYKFADQETAKIEFLGSIPRYADFKTAITILEKCGAVEFTITDNKIVISPIKD